jgi:SAM-dependent methyltransferase
MEYSNFFFDATSSDIFSKFALKNEIYSIDKIEKLVKSVTDNGLILPITSQNISPNDISITSKNYRETISAAGLSSRSRATLLVLESLVGEKRIEEITIHCAEALSGFSLKLRGIFPKSICTEYSTDEDVIRKLYPIPIADLSDLDFPDSSFDFQVSNDVLEHVPDISMCLRESIRILKFGGYSIFTVPFDTNAEKNSVRAILENGVLKHLKPPEYHGDPLSKDGVLVFCIPGWEILNQALSAGFSSAFLRFVSSEKHGVVGADSTGILVVVCKK